MEAISLAVFLDALNAVGSIAAAVVGIGVIVNMKWTFGLHNRLTVLEVMVAAKEVKADG